jgi:hypothetical protein
MTTPVYYFLEIYYFQDSSRVSPVDLRLVSRQISAACRHARGDTTRKHPIEARVLGYISAALCSIVDVGTKAWASGEWDDAAFEKRLAEYPGIPAEVAREFLCGRYTFRIRD